MRWSTSCGRTTLGSRGRGIHAYLRYLDHYGSVASRLGEAGVPAWVVHGETGDGGITDDERRTLEAFALVTVITIPGGSFFMPNEEPALIAGLVRRCARAGIGAARGLTVTPDRSRLPSPGGGGSRRQYCSGVGASSRGQRLQSASSPFTCET